MQPWLPKVQTKAVVCSVSVLVSGIHAVVQKEVSLKWEGTNAGVCNKEEGSTVKLQQWIALCRWMTCCGTVCHLVLLCLSQLAYVIVCGRYWRLPVLMAVWCIFVFCSVVYIQISLLNTKFENDTAVPTDWEGQKVFMKGTYLHTFSCLERGLCCRHTCTWPCFLYYELGSLAWLTLPCLDALDCCSALLVPFKSCRTAPC